MSVMTSEAQGDIDHRRLRKLDTVFRRFRNIENMMPLSMAHALILVALNEGSNLNELVRISGVSQSQLSRYLLELSDKARDGDLGSGYGLVNRDVDPTELRRNRYTLSPKGKVFFQELLADIRTERE